MGNLNRVWLADDLQWVNNYRKRLANSRYGEGLFIIPERITISAIARKAIEKHCAIPIAFAPVSSIKPFQNPCLTGWLRRYGAHLLALPFRLGGQFCIRLQASSW